MIPVTTKGLSKEAQVQNIIKLDTSYRIHSSSPLTTV